MTDQELLGLLMNRGWSRYGITNELVISSDSQTIVSRAAAARLKKIDPDAEAHYEMVQPQG